MLLMFVLGVGVCVRLRVVIGEDDEEDEDEEEDGDEGYDGLDRMTYSMRSGGWWLCWAWWVSGVLVLGALVSV